MGSDANTLTVRGRRAQQGQCKNRSDQCFHRSFLGLSETVSFLRLRETVPKVP
jgi:hypothetical protein